jgi:type II secretory pathway pseudopilin PulG
MKKLNNKGVTLIEVLLCFVLVAIIVLSITSSVTTYKNKAQFESNKEQVMTYKNNITKLINDDFVKIGLTEVTGSYTSGSNPKQTVYEFRLKDNTNRRLIIAQYTDQRTRDYISYGPSGTDNSNLELNTLPDLGMDESDDNTKKYSFYISSVENNTIAGYVFSIRIKLYYADMGDKYDIKIITPINYLYD